jgi:hypothetical protein
LFLGEQPATQQEAQLRLKHAVGLLNLDVLEATITVPGWLQDNGQLWISLVGATNYFRPRPPLVVLNVFHTFDEKSGRRRLTPSAWEQRPRINGDGSRRPVSLTGGGDAIGF